VVIVPHWEAITMTKNEDTKLPDHHSDVAIASIWVLLLSLIVVIEIGSLMMTRSMLAAVLR
jgi:hypothetical protein